MSAAGWAQAAGWVLPQAAYTDAQAVSAVLAFAAYDFDVFFTPLVVATPTPTSYRLITTDTLAAGTWSVSFAVFLTGSNSGTEIGANIEVDGNPLGLVRSSAVVPGGGYIQSATAPFVWAAGVHTIEYFANQPSGPGEVTVVDSFTTWERKA